MEPPQRPKCGVRKRAKEANADRRAKRVERRTGRRAGAAGRAGDEDLADAEEAATFEGDAPNDEAVNLPLSVGDQESAPPTPEDGTAPIIISDDPPQRGVGHGATPAPSPKWSAPTHPDGEARAADASRRAAADDGPRLTAAEAITVINRAIRHEAGDGRMVEIP